MILIVIEKTIELGTNSHKVLPLVLTWYNFTYTITSWMWWSNFLWVGYQSPSIHDT